MICGGLFLYAQEENPVKKEKMVRDVQDFKMRYIAQEMDLSELQKKQFFEVYQEMSESKKECFQEAMLMERNLKKEKDPSDEEYLKVRNALNQANAKWAETEQQYDEKFSEFLTQKQIYKMKEAETSFRSKFEEMKHKRKKEHHKPDSKKELDK